jgi:hypothetical protein
MTSPDVGEASRPVVAPQSPLPLRAAFGGHADLVSHGHAISLCLAAADGADFSLCVVMEAGAAVAGVDVGVLNGRMYCIVACGPWSFTLISFTGQPIIP